MGDEKGNSGKSSKLSFGNFLTPADKKTRPSGSGSLGACVSPVLRDVSKLAAGVAAVSASGSATGNPRNKCALEPGHSLMDWIRLGASGKDLTGVGPCAGRLEITLEELRKHDQIKDAWLAMRGKVYNVTSYLTFHPGGVSEIMKGVGKDATDMFDNIHPWVNYEKILAKCLVGKLVLPPPDKTTIIKSISASKVGTSSDSASKIPRFDWIQKMESINLIFYTQALANPYVEITPPENNSLTISIEYGGFVFENDVEFFSKIKYPGTMKINYETGKVDFVFQKYLAGIWERFGIIKQKKMKEQKPTALYTLEYKIIKNVKINYNTHIIQYERSDKVRHNIPIGRHVVMTMMDKGDILVRSYTPCPDSVFTSFKSTNFTTDTVCLLVKIYPKGRCTTNICKQHVNEGMDFCKPIGTYSLKAMERFELLILCAAGTGITPMFGIISFALERRIRSCQKVTLIYFNRTENDILCRDQLQALTKEDHRFTVNHILSNAEESWSGATGHINVDIIEKIIGDYISETAFTRDDIFLSACGPTGFVDTAENMFLNRMKIRSENMYLFSG